jgi:hypothetical protein
MNLVSGQNFDQRLSCFPKLITMSGLAIDPKGAQSKPDTDISDLAGRIIFISGGVFIRTAH